MDFVVKMGDKEYRSDGTFHAEVHNLHDDETVEVNSAHKRQLSSVETIAIGSCATIFLLGTAVFVWKFYVSDSNLEFIIYCIGDICVGDVTRSTEFLLHNQSLRKVRACTKSSPPPPPHPSLNTPH